MIKKLVTSVQEEHLNFIASLILLMHPHTSTDGFCLFFFCGKNNNNNLNSQIVKLFERDCMQSVHSSSTICHTMRPCSTLCGAPNYHLGTARMTTSHYNARILPQEQVNNALFIIIVLCKQKPSVLRKPHDHSELKEFKEGWKISAQIRSQNWSKILNWWIC